MWILWIDFKEDVISECKTCKLRHVNCHSHCPYGKKRSALFEQIRRERELISDLNAYDKESKRRMNRTRSTTGMRL